MLLRLVRLITFIVVKTKSIQPRHFTLTDKNFTVVVQSASGYDSDATYAYYRNNFRFRLREGVCEILQDTPTLAISDGIMTPDIVGRPFFLGTEKEMMNERKTKIYPRIKYLEQIHPRLASDPFFLPIHPLTSFPQIVLSDFIDPLSRFKTLRLQPLEGRVLRLTLVLLSASRI